MSAYKDYMNDMKLSEDFKNALVGKMNDALSVPVCDKEDKHKKRVRRRAVYAAALSVACAAAVCLIVVPLMADRLFTGPNGSSPGDTNIGTDSSPQQAAEFSLGETAEDIYGNTLRFDDIVTAYKIDDFTPSDGNCFIIIGGEAHFIYDIYGEYITFTESDMEKSCEIDGRVYELSFRQDIFDQSRADKGEPIDGQFELVFETDESFISALAEGERGEIMLSLGTFGVEGKYSGSILTIFNLSLESLISE